MADPKMVARVERLLALAADKSTSEEERRTAAVTAARLMREHGIGLGVQPAISPPAGEEMTTRVRVQTMIGGVNAAVEVVSQGLGFDVAVFLQDLLRARVQAALRDAVAPAPAVVVRTVGRKRKR